LAHICLGSEPFAEVESERLPCVVVEDQSEPFIMSPTGGYLRGPNGDLRGADADVGAAGAVGCLIVVGRDYWALPHFCAQGELFAVSARRAGPLVVA
jgi:hypothetical protein